MDGLIVVGASGRPIVLSRFRYKLATYAHVHVDRLNSELAGIERGAGPSSGDAFSGKSVRREHERDLDPVLYVPVDPTWEENESEGDDSIGSDDSSDDSESAQSVAADDNVWKNRTAGSAASDASSSRDVDGDGSMSVLCHIKAGELRFLCPVSREVDPLVPFAFLRKFVSVLLEYLVGSADESLLTEELVREHFDIVYELLEEMLDGEGAVLITEPNSLKDIVLPPSWLDKLVKTVGLGSHSERSRSSLTSGVPWRRPNSKYNKNEINFDFIDSLEGIVSADGAPIALDLWGTIECTAWLSGMPLVTMKLNKPGALEDVAFHACVRHEAWGKSQQISFVPPDGMCELASYRLAPPSGALSRSRFLQTSSGTELLPLAIDVDVDADGDTAARGQRSGTAFCIAIEARVPARNALEDVSLEWDLGSSAHALDASTHTRHAQRTGASSIMGGDDVGTSTPASAGSVVFDRATRRLRWSIAKVGATQQAVLKGTIVTDGEPCHPGYAMQVRASVPGHSLAGVRIDAVQLDREPYVPRKGFRSVLRADLEWRI